MRGVSIKILINLLKYPRGAARLVTRTPSHRVTGQNEILVKIIAYPAAKFFIDYFWFLGFLDGTAGAVVALMMSFHSFLTRAKLWLLWHKHEAKCIFVGVYRFGVRSVFHWPHCTVLCTGF